MSLLDHLAIVFLAVPALALLQLFNSRDRTGAERRGTACEQGHCSCRAAMEAMSDRSPQEEKPR